MDTSIEPNDAYVLQGAQDDVEFIKAEADHVNKVLVKTDFLLKLRTHLFLYVYIANWRKTWNSVKCATKYC